MAESDEIHQWLSREVGELLNVGSVGLYEFMELLNDDTFELDDSDRRRISIEVVKNIIGSGSAQLYEVTWPKGEVLAGPFDENFVDTLGTSFPAAASEHYLALLP